VRLRCVGARKCSQHCPEEEPPSPHCCMLWHAQTRQVSQYSIFNCTHLRRACRPAPALRHHRSPAPAAPAALHWRPGRQCCCPQWRWHQRGRAAGHAWLLWQSRYSCAAACRGRRKKASGRRSPQNSALAGETCRLSPLRLSCWRPPFCRCPRQAAVHAAASWHVGPGPQLSRLDGVDVLYLHSNKHEVGECHSTIGWRLAITMQHNLRTMRTVR
jgi:hypothetical protein